MPTANDLIKLAMQHVGEQYDWGANVPFDDPSYRGPWDCAEFASWLVYQLSGSVIGCVDNAAPIDALEPYSASWARDAETMGQPLTIAEAAGVRGAVLVRRPSNDKPGHVAFSRGDGTTIEAMSATYGVAVGKVNGRKWHSAFMLPGFQY